MCKTPQGRRPANFQGKAFLRQALAKLQLSRKITLYFLQSEFTDRLQITKCPRPCYHGTNRSQCVSGCHGHPPFLQNMLLTIYTGHYIHATMYVYIIFRQNFNDKQNCQMLRPRKSPYNSTSYAKLMAIILTQQLFLVV